MADASYKARSDRKHAPLATQSSNAVNRPALALLHTCCSQSHLSYGITLRHRFSPFCTAHHRHSSPTLVTVVTLVPHHHPYSSHSSHSSPTLVTDTRHRHSSHSSPSPTPSTILARTLVVINLLINTLSTILHQLPAPPLRQPPTAVSRRQHQQQQQQPTTLCRCRTGFGSIGRAASPACQPAW